MKRKLHVLLAALGLFVGTSVNAQVFIDDDFDNHPVGNVGTDLTGATPGIGNWHTIVPAGGANSDFQFVTETGRGNVFAIQSTNQQPAASGTPGNQRVTFNSDFDSAAWSGKSAGNNILRIEYDFYTGSTNSKAHHRMIVESANRLIAGFDYNTETGVLNGLAYTTPPGGQADAYFINFEQGGTVVSADTWYKLIMHIDFTKNEATWEVPTTTISASYSLTAPGSPAAVAFVAAPATGNNASSTMKFDNYKVSAVNTTTVSVKEEAPSKFNLFPNPVNDIVTISNQETIGIEDISIIDMNGKVVKTFTFTNQSEVQLNVSDLKSGIYIFNISTKEGIETKRVIKK